MEDVYLQHEFIWLFRCNIIIIFCKIGASQLDTPVTTLDRITITYTFANNRIHFFPILLGIGNSIREFHYHCAYNCDPRHYKIKQQIQIVVSTHTAGHHYIILVDINCTTQPVMKSYFIIFK